MSIEIWALCGATLIAFVSMFMHATSLDLTAGVKYVLSSRDETVTEGKYVGRLRRNSENQKEGLIYLIPLVIAASAADVSNVWTQYAAIAYVLARIAYVPAYVLNMVPLRTIFWMVGIFSLPVFAFGLIKEVGFPF